MFCYFLYNKINICKNMNWIRLAVVVFCKHNTENVVWWKNFRF
jgi:hypothetical protein